MIIDTGLTEDDLLAAVFDAVDTLVDANPPQQPGEFTVAEYRQHRGLTYDQAAKMIDRLCEAGKLTKRRTIVGGKSTNVYGLTTKSPGC